MQDAACPAPDCDQQFEGHEAVRDSDSDVDDQAVSGLVTPLSLSPSSSLFLSLSLALSLSLSLTLSLMWMTRLYRAV